MTKLLKELPDFISEEEEFEFWTTHDSSEYMDWKNAKPISFPHLRSAAGVVEIVLTDEELQQIKSLAKATSKSFVAVAEELLHEGLARRLAA